MEKNIQKSDRQSVVYSMLNDPAFPGMQLLMKQGKCRHMLNGSISYGLCSRGYNCIKCPFDQMMEDAGYLTN